MNSNPQNLTPDSTSGNIPATKHLTDEQIQVIDDALAEVGESGIVRLVIAEGRLYRVVAQTQQSFDVDDYQPGMNSDVH